VAGADRPARRLLSADRGAGRLLVVFLDGVGLGPPDLATNPFATASLPTLEALLDGDRPFRDRAGRSGERATLVAVDATHGVPGTPQSGTGHTSLLTGEDGVALFGRHYGPWVPTALRPVVAERSLLARAGAAGATAAFANAYPEELIRRVPTGVPVAEAVTAGRLGPLRSGPPLAALGAGLLTRHTDALARGDAVASEIVNDGWIERLGRSLPRIAPADAGRRLAAIAAAHDVTLFAHYTTDYVGHRGTLDDAVAALERVDAFLGGVVADLPSDALLLVVSDHGNIEDVRAEHTLNPALGLVVGPGHKAFAAEIADLRDVAPAALRRLGVEA
jgi:2,3-bisphosphoglycerate-independent phosphoglycerate mutase